MKKLSYFEFIKAYKRKSFLFAVVLMLLAMILIPCITIQENYWVLADGTSVSGIPAIRAQRNAQKETAGTLTSEKIQAAISSYQAAYGNPENFVSDGAGGTYLGSPAYGKYIQPYENINNLLRSAFAAKGETSNFYVMDKLTSSDADDFYDRRMDKVEEYLNTDYSYGNYSEADKAYYIAKNEALDTPFRIGYCEGWEKLLSVSTISMMVIVLAICISLAPAFSSEYQTGADAILLSTKYGKNKLILAKIVSSFILTSGLYWGGMLILTAVTFIIYGADGGHCSLQTLNLLSPSNVTLLESFLYVLLAGYAMCLLMQGLTLLLSAMLSSPFPVIIITLVFYFVPSFISYSRSSRLFNNLLNLFPVKMAAAYTSLAKYELYHILFLKVPYSVMMILVATAVAVVTLPFAYKRFRAHQVA